MSLTRVCNTRVTIFNLTVPNLLRNVTVALHIVTPVLLSKQNEHIPCYMINTKLNCD